MAKFNINENSFVLFIRRNYQYLSLAGVIPILLSAIAIPNVGKKFLFLQYEVGTPMGGEPNVTYHTYGSDDLYIIGFILLLLGLVRYISQGYLIKMIAMLIGIKKKHIIVKFQEAAWFAAWYCISFSLGFYVLFVEPSTPTLSGFDSTVFWKNRHIVSYWTKMLSMIQFAMWVHCFFAVSILESPRKDYYEMLSHHVITIILANVAAFFGLMKYGTMVSFTCDMADILLYSLKCGKYVADEVYSSLQKANEIGFGGFVVVWILSRHGLYNWLVWKWWFEFPVVDPTVSAGVYYSVGILFIVLQGIMLIWLWMIFKLVLNKMKGGKVHDSRSDDEEESSGGESHNRPEFRRRTRSQAKKEQ